jgi:hypothetical protein
MTYQFRRPLSIQPETSSNIVKLHILFQLLKQHASHPTGPKHKHLRDRPFSDVNTLAFVALM